MASEAEPRAPLADAGGAPLSVGYLPGVFAPAELPARHRVIPATRLRRAQALPAGTPARIRVHGLTAGGAALADRVDGIDLDAILPGPGGRRAAPLSFYAWTMRTGAHGGCSNATSFVAGLDKDPGLGFALIRHRTVDGRLDRDEANVVLSTTGRNGAVVLCPGTYLLGIEPGCWDDPVRLPAAGNEAAWRALLSLVVHVQPA